MADEKSSIFNQHAAEKLRSPDDLDKYVRVTNPSVWVLLIACIALVLGLLAWGIFGTVSTSVNAMGVNSNGTTICFLDAKSATHVEVGDQASIDGQTMTVSDISTVPVSRDEARAMVANDYLASTLMTEDWAYVVTLEPDSSGTDLKSDVPLDVTITTERVAPISLIFSTKA